MNVACARVYELYLYVLVRTGAASRLAAWPLPVPPAGRPLALLVAGTSVVLLLYAVLAAGSDPWVRSFRALTLLSGLALPLAALRFAGTAGAPAFGGCLILVATGSGLAHRFLATRRRPGAASRAIERARWAVETAGLLLFASGVALLASDRPVPIRLAFWALFLLRLSVSDLLDPSRLASATGLSRSALKDARKAAGAGRRVRPARRLSAAAAGALKGLLLAAWLLLPLAAALAPGEVAAGVWPGGALALRHYPLAALAATALVLVGDGLASLRKRPVEAVRALVAGFGTAAYLLFAYGDPAFAAYRASLPALVLLETAFGFLLGAARRERS